MQRAVTISTIKKRAISGFFLPRLVQIQLVVKEEMSFEAIVDVGHPKITIAHYERKAQVS